MTNREEFDYSMQIACIQPVSYYPATTPLVRLGIGLNWLWERKGVGGTNLFEPIGFVTTRASIKQRNLQYHFMALAGDYNAESKRDLHAYQTMMSMMLPESWGSLWLKSSDPTLPFAIQLNFLSNKQNRRNSINVVQMTRCAMSMPAFNNFHGEELAVKYRLTGF